MYWDSMVYVYYYINPHLYIHNVTCIVSEIKTSCVYVTVHMKFHVYSHYISRNLTHKQLVSYESVAMDILSVVCVHHIFLFYNLTK